MIDLTDNESSTQVTSKHCNEDDDDLESVDSTGFNYPAPHPHLLSTPINPKLLISCLRSQENTPFDPVEARTLTTAHFTAISFVDREFNAEGQECTLHGYTNNIIPAVKQT